MKRLIVCCDGTWQKLDSNYPTNVVKIAQAIKPVCDDGITQQIVYYDEGVGTGDRLDRIFGGAFGWGIDKNIQDAYRFLCLNYQTGDEIYLYGFSRGAYTVRSLAGLILCSGLLERNQIRQAGKAYKIYRDDHIKPDDPEAIEFRQQFSSKNVRITLLACWDTVGSLGIPDQIPLIPIDRWLNKKYKFHDTILSSIIDNALHAVAIDEIRKVFKVTIMQPSQSNKKQHLEQVWFAGTHGCVGGGIEAISGLSDIALMWTIEQSEKLKIEFDTSRIITGVNPNPETPFDNKPQGIFRLTGIKLREVKEDSQLHSSVKDRWSVLGQGYRPDNLLVQQAYLDGSETSNIA